MLARCLAPIENVVNAFEQSYVGYLSGNRQMLRAWTYPANPESTSQVQVRSWLTQVAIAFQSLTSEERDAWEALGAQMEDTDALGRTFTLNAIAAYSRVNFYRLLDGTTITDTAPSYISNAAPIVTGVTRGDPDVEVTFTHAQADGFFVVRYTSSLPSPVRLARKNELRLPENPLTANLVARSASPQTIALEPDNVTIAGDSYIGVEIVPLSAGYVPGVKTFVRSIQAVAP
jgi:hypothetical protein